MSERNIEARQLSAREKQRLDLYRGRWPYPWRHEGEKWVDRLLVPIAFGDGRSAVQISFYSAPDIVAVVLWDSKVPLDSEQRFRPHAEPTFRDALDAIYDELETLAFPASEHRQHLVAEASEWCGEEEWSDDERLWKFVINSGSTWGVAQKRRGRSK